jgi:hypothetical protein
LNQLGYTDFMQGKQTVQLCELEAAAASGTQNPDGYLDRMVDARCHQLCSWATEHPDPAACLVTAV